MIELRWLIKEVMLAKDQLHNAVELLNRGYYLHEQVEPLLEEYGDIDNVPVKND